MPLPIHEDALRKKKSLQLQVFPGLGGGADLLNSESEDHRRRRAATLSPAPAETPAAAAPPQPSPFFPPPPILPTIVDRWHKWSSHYVFVGKDHINDDKPLNPGYAPDGTASTINAGYAYARDVLLPKIPVGDRVVLVIAGGTWTEDLTIDNSSIDIQGFGRPIVTGHWTITGDVTRCLIDNIWVIAPIQSSGTQALIPPYAVTIKAPNVSKGDVEIFVDQSQIEIKNCVFEGLQGGLYTGRRILAEDSYFLIPPPTPGSPIAGQFTEAVRVDVSPADMRWCIFRRCTLQGRMTFNPFQPFVRTNYWGPLGWQADGRALYASASIGGVDGNYYNYEQIPFTGVKLEWCTIIGQCVADGWRVYHEWCNCYQVSIYGLVRGMPITEGYVYHVIGQMRFNHCDVYSRYVATFDGKYPKSLGECHFIHSDAMQLVDVPVTAQAFLSQPNGQGFLYVVKSSTSAAAWGVTVGSPLESVIVDSDINVPAVALSSEYFR